MEVKDLIKDDLTDEQLKDLEIQERRTKYKLLQEYLNTDDYKYLVEQFKTRGNGLEAEILEALKDRKETKVTKSELDRSQAFYDFQNELIEELGNSEAEEILKADLRESAQNTYTHIMNKIEELYDAPIYTELDFLRILRIDYILVEKRIGRMVAYYLDSKEVNDNPNPYED